MNVCLKYCEYIFCSLEQSYLNIFVSNLHAKALNFKLFKLAKLTFGVRQSFVLLLNV